MTDLSAIVDELYEASAAGDFDRVEGYLTDDFFVEEASSLPFAGKYIGKSALRELFPVMMKTLGVTGLSRESVMVGDHSVSAVVTLEVGEQEPVEMLEVFHFRGDKVCEIRPYYFDVNKVAAAAKASKIEA